MGQKVHPYGFRLDITYDWKSHWLGKRKYAEYLNEDVTIRSYLEKNHDKAFISFVEIDRKGDEDKVNVRIHSGRPAIIIGRKGEGVKTMQAELEKIIGKKMHIDVEQIQRPELEATLVAKSIAEQLEQRVSFRKAMKSSMRKARDAAEREGIPLGIRVQCSGRLGGAEMARKEWYREGKVPLQTLKALVDYGFAAAKTTYGVIGVKVWIYKGERKGKSLREEQEGLKDRR